jgi:acyl-ACP thioesterase
MQLEPYEFAETFPVFRHEVDYRGKIQPGGILRFAQQVANDQCLSYGITDETYQKTNTAFVLAKVAVRFERLPVTDEKLTLITQPQKLIRAVNKRLTRVLDEAGREAVLVDSRWVLIDVSRRMILRTHPAEIEGPWAEKIERELPMRISRPEQTNLIGTYRAEYAQCDMNGHLNNTRYADVICNALPLHALDGKEYRDMRIFYHREIPRGEAFELRSICRNENDWYFCGVREGNTCFEAELVLREKPENEENYHKKP